MLTSRDERVLVGMAMAAGRSRLARVARAVLDRDDNVTEAIRAAADSTDTFKSLTAVLDRHDGQRWGFHLLDLVVEVSQQDLERRGEPRTYHWPESGTNVSTPTTLGRHGARAGEAGRRFSFVASGLTVTQDTDRKRQN